MATVQVNSWSEFVTAVAVSGDTVVCPENAVWDMNEIAPEGVAGVTIKCAEIQGNGTEIANLRITTTGIVFIVTAAYTPKVTSLHFTNFICESTALFGGSSSNAGLYVTFERCKFSGILPQNVYCMFYGGTYVYATFTRCSFALEMLYSGSNQVCVVPKYTYGAIPLKYCRVYVQAPNATQCNVFAEWSYIKSDCPNVTRLWIGNRSTAVEASVFDGEMPSVTATDGKSPTSYPCIFNADTIPIASVANVLGVTEAQLRDPAYLASIGFPIGVEV